MIQAPQQGAVQVSKLARRDSEDAIGWVTDWYAERGWKVCDEGAGVTTAGGGYLMVTVWAVSPNKQQLLAAAAAKPKKQKEATS